MLKAGLEGVLKKMPLTVKDCGGHLTAAQLSESARNALGIEKRMPLSWGEGRQAFVDDKDISEWFGQEFIDKYLSVNKVTLAIPFPQSTS
jgi:glutamine synthetase